MKWERPVASGNMSFTNLNLASEKGEVSKDLTSLRS